MKIDKKTMVALATHAGVDCTGLTVDEIYGALYLRVGMETVPKSALTTAREEVRVLREALARNDALLRMEQMVRHATPVEVTTTSKRLRSICPEIDGFDWAHSAKIRETGTAFIVNVEGRARAAILCRTLTAAHPDRWVSVQHGTEVSISKGLRTPRR